MVLYTQSVFLPLSFSHRRVGPARQLLPPLSTRELCARSSSLSIGSPPPRRTPSPLAQDGGRVRVRRKGGKERAGADAMAAWRRSGAGATAAGCGSGETPARGRKGEGAARHRHEGGRSRERRDTGARLEGHGSRTGAMVVGPMSGAGAR